MTHNPLKKRLMAIGAVLATALAGVAARAADYPTTVLSYNPLAYWRFSETAPGLPGIVAVNSGSLGASANGYGVLDPAATNAITGNAGIVGKAYRFSNAGPTVGYAGTKVDVPWSAALNPQGSFSVEFWANPAELTTDLFSPLSSLDGDGGYRFGWLFYLDGPSNGWMFRLGAGSGYAGLVLSAANTAKANQWQHVVGVYDDSAKTISLYLNGVLAAGPTKTSTPFVANVYNPVGNGTGRALRLGGTGLTGEGTITGNRGYDGLLDEVAIYPAPLAAARISAHYNTALTNNAGYKAAVLADAPLAYYGLDEAAYTAPDPSTYPTTANAGSLGAAADGRLSPGLAAGVAGPPFSGFGADNTAIWANGAAGNVQATNLDVVGPNITLAAWVNPSLSDNLRDIVAHGYTAAGADVTGEIFLRINGDQYEVGSWDGTTTYSAAATIPDGDLGNWVFLAGTFDGANWNLYRYDQLIATSPQPTGAFSFDASWGIASRGDADTLDARIFGGGVDEVAVFPTALALSDIQAIFYSAKPWPILTVAPVPPSGPVFVGSSLSFSGFAAGAPPISYQWTKDGSALPGQTATNLSLANLKVSDSGTYALVVSNPNGSITNSFQVTVLSAPPFFTAESGSISRFAGASATFSVASGGANPLSYQWSFGNSPITGATASTYTLANVQPANAGAYSVAVSNPSGTTNSTPAILTVLPDPIGYGSLILGDKPIAYYRLDETSGTVAHDYWGGNDGQYIGNVTLGQTGFSVIDSDTAAGFGSANTLVGNISGTAINFTGTNVQYSLEAWVNGPASQVSGAGIIAKGEGNNGGNGDEQFAIDVNGGFFRFYVREQSDDAAVEADSTVAPDGAWHHLVAVYDGVGQTMTLYVDGAVAASQTAPASGPRTSSHPVSIGARQSGVDPAYDLYFNGSIDEVAFYNTALSQAQVSAHFAAQYGAHQAPLVAVAPVGATNYVGLPITLSASGVGTIPISYQWLKDGKPIPSATTPTYTIPVTATTDSGSYSVTISNPVGSTNTVAVTVSILPAPTAPVQIPGLVLHLPFDGSLSDTSGHNNNGTAVGKTSFVTDGKVGGGGLHYYTDLTDPSNLSFNYVTLGTPNDLLFSSNVNFSVAFWVRLPANYAGGDLPFIGNVVGSTFGTGWVLVPTYGDPTANWPGGWAYSFFDATGNGIGVYGDVGNINDGNWHHLVYVFDRKAGETTYLDGIVSVGSRQSGSTAAAAGNVDTGKTINIGQDPTGTYQPYAGEADSADLDDLGIWRTALTPLQAAALYTAGAGGVSFAPAPAAVNLTITGNADGSITITYGAGGVLQSSTSINGPFTAVSGATSSPYKVTPGAGNLFYRASY